MKLAKAISQHDHQFVVILDGDYHVLTQTRSSHRRVVHLNRYAIENYLFESTVVEQVARSYARVGPMEEVIGDRLNNLASTVHSELSEMVVIDAAHQLSNSGIAACPKSAELLLKDKDKLDFNAAAISSYCAKGKSTIEYTAIENAQALVAAYLEKHRLVDLLRGHVVYDLIRFLVWASVTRKAGKPPRFNKESLFVALSSEVWRSDHLTDDHRKLKRKLFEALREVRASITP